MGWPGWPDKRMSRMPERRESWHVGKEIPLAMIFAIFMQTVGVVWWAATLAAKMDDLSYQVAALTADKYTKSDAEKDQKYVNQRLSDMERRVTNVERKQ